MHSASPLPAILLAMVGLCGHGSATLLERKSHIARTPATPSRQDIYEAAEDLWAKALALNTLAPEFQFQNNTEVAAQVGGEATFSCYTYHLSDEMVAWLKREDDMLLTVGHQVYASEKRFSVVHKDHDEAWELWVKDVQQSDSGQYECQLTTNPPVSYFFSLVVTQAEAVVGGPSEVHIEEGSQMALECWVKQAPVPPVYIFWYHNNTMVNYARQHHLQVEHENYTSSLVVARVRPSDAGTYSCQPHLAIPANVTVHVVTGKRPAAMQHGRRQEEVGSISSTTINNNSNNNNNKDDNTLSGASPIRHHYSAFLLLLLTVHLVCATHTLAGCLRPIA